MSRGLRDTALGLTTQSKLTVQAPVFEEVSGDCLGRQFSPKAGE
ncbi:hypothetical protein [Desulfosporosinus sp. BG]|nr:hypothetical protein [Desulfosporosinus sp. BG]ODA39126.1 hypothetical protein DSBG_4103 [Desulfosporosinus sp. BG]